MLFDDVIARIPMGSEIPKPAAKAAFRLLRIGTRRGERALIYSIPNHTTPELPYQKGLTESDFELAESELARSGELTREWFQKNLVRAAKEGGCNFTSLGGLLQLLGRVEYVERGRYASTKRS